jgi:hypothetical protein
VVFLAVAALFIAADVGGTKLPQGLHLGAGVGAGVVGGDVSAMVDVVAGIETAPFALHLRTPLTLRLIDLPPSVSPSSPSWCRQVRCEELLNGQALDPTAIARVVDELRLFRPGDTVHARVGRLAATLGAGASVDRFTTMASWDRRTSGAFASARIPDVGVDVVVADVVSPLELIAGRIEVVPLGLPVVMGIEGAIDAFAPDDVVDDDGVTRPGAATRSLGMAGVDARVPVFLGPFTIAPRLELAGSTGLRADGGDVGDGVLPLGGGIAGGVDAAFKMAFLEIRALGVVGAASPGYRRGLFSTFHLVERRQALAGSVVDGGGVVHVPAPGGVGLDLRLDASVLDAVAPLLRLHLEPAPGANALEVGVVVDIDPVQLSLSATRRAFVDIAGVVDSDLGRRPLLLVAEAGWRVWGPLSLWARWYRLPRFRDGTLAIDDDVLVGMSVNGALTPR